MASKLLSKQIKGDKVIWIVVCFLSIFSLLAVYSSIVTLAFKYHAGNTSYYLFKHIIILSIGILIIILFQNIPYRYYSRLSQIFLIIAIPLLALTLFMGTNINEASRWMVIPVINQSFQTSDLAKVALIMYVARLLSKKQGEIKNFKSAFVPIMLPILVVCGLILPANFSTAAMLFVICLILMFMGRISIKYILSLIGIGIFSFALFIYIITNVSVEGGRVGTWKSRIEQYTKNGTHEEGYQVKQSKIAIASGGVIGKQPGHSTQRNFLPHAYSDFIYSIIIEEYGFIGGVFIIFLYLILFFRGVVTARKCKRPFGSLLAIGLTFSIVFQAFINIGVAVNLFPVTGQPLPMISMGGTSIWTTCLIIGIILSVSKEEEKDQEENTEKEEEVAYANA